MLIDVIIALLVAERVWFYYIIYSTKQDREEGFWGDKDEPKSKTKRRSPVKKTRR